MLTMDLLSSKDGIAGVDAPAISGIHGQMTGLFETACKRQKLYCSFLKLCLRIMLSARATEFEAARVNVR